MPSSSSLAKGGGSLILPPSLLPMYPVPLASVCSWALASSLLAFSALWALEQCWFLTEGGQAIEELGADRRSSARERENTIAKSSLDNVMSESLLWLGRSRIELKNPNVGPIKLLPQMESRYDNNKMDLILNVCDRPFYNRSACIVG